MRLRPLGWFAHHQGRGHAVRCAAVLHALPPERPVTVFCARDDIFPTLPAQARVVRIPSLFEPTGDEPPGLADLATPDTMHCAPVGWATIRTAMATMSEWFREADPALMVSDVSAEVAQLARLCSVPHVMIRQHGDRTDPGHQAAYRGALGLLAPYHRDLAQPNWRPEHLARTCFAPGLGLRPMPERRAARTRLGLDPQASVAVVVSGGGGDGVSQAPLAVAARAVPSMRWVTIGEVRRDWHATEPGNLEHRGWVDDADDYIAAADLVVSSSGNTTCAQVLAAARPWIAVPEWRYFDEQIHKAQALSRVGAALHLPQLPSSAHRWAEAVKTALATHDPVAQRRLVRDDGAERAAAWLEDLAHRAWARPSSSIHSIAQRLHHA